MAIADFFRQTLEGVHAPELTGGTTWLNSKPLTLKELRVHIVLLDFWDYSCINCVRTLPYLIEWYRRYKQYGFVIIGIHAPEFEFAKDPKNVEVAIKKFGIEHPVVLDNNFAIWQAFANSVWPREFLLDAESVIRHDNSGEGGYGETEELIQDLLRAQNPQAKFPSILEPVRDTDEPGAVCYPTTPELYAGYDCGRLGNPEGYRPGQVVTYRDPGATLAPDQIHAVGEWENNEQNLRHARTTTDQSDAILFKYRAAEVYAVIKPEPEAKAGFRVYLTQNGQPLTAENKGQDVTVDQTGSYITVNEARMYYLVKNPAFGQHVLKLSSDSDAFAFYTFTFGSACAPTAA